MKKRILTTVMAGAMALSLAAPAFAASTPVKPVAETTEANFEVALEGMIYTPTIRVQVTDSGSVYVNPSKSVVAGTMTKALDGTKNLDYSFSGQGVVSTPILIRSDTDQKLQVSATGTATVPNKAAKVKIVSTLATSNVEAPEVTLSINGNGDTGLGTSAALETTTGDDGTVTVGLDADKIGGTALKLVPAADGKSAAPAKTGVVATIEKAEQTKDASGKVTAVVPQYGFVVVQGTATDPTKFATGVAWTENDTVNVNVALSFAIAEE